MDLSKPRQNYNSIDLFKFLMAICVVAIHTHPLEHAAGGPLVRLFDFLISMSVPYFFLASGFLLASKFRPDDNAGAVRTVAKQLGRTVKLYFLWCAIYAPFSVYYYITFKSGNTLLHTLASYARCLLCIGGHYNAYQLWYLLSTIYALIFVMILLRQKVSTRLWPALLVCLCGISIAMDVLAEYEGNLSGVLRIARTMLDYTTIDGRPLQGFFLIPAGMLMANRKIPFKKCLPVFVLCLFLGFMTDSGVLSRAMKYLGAAALFGMTLHIRLKDRPVYPMLRLTSTDMYLMHMYVWIIYSALADGKKRYGFDSFLVTVLVCTAIGIVHFRSGRKKAPAAAKN